MTENLLPSIGLHASLAQEPVLILSKKEIQAASKERLITATSYYENCLEALAGKQVWMILEALALIEQRQQLDSKTDNVHFV